MPASGSNPAGAGAAGASTPALSLISLRTASWRRAAALPVGAASAIRPGAASPSSLEGGPRSRPRWWSSPYRDRPTPRRGRRWRAIRTAARCRSSGAEPAKSRSSAASISSASVPSPSTDRASRRNSAATVCSAAQKRARVEPIPPVHHERARLPRLRRAGQRAGSRPAPRPRVRAAEAGLRLCPRPGATPGRPPAATQGKACPARAHALARARRRGQLQAAPSVDLRHQLPEVPVDVREVVRRRRDRPARIAPPRRAEPIRVTGRRPPRKQSSSACRQAAGGRSK